MIIPPVRRTRQTALPFDITGQDNDLHLPWVDDYCLHCGADLRVLRKIVDRRTVSIADRYMLLISKSAERAVHEPEPGYTDLMLRLELTETQQNDLMELYCEAIEPDVTFICGLDNFDAVGISADGTILYAAINTNLPRETL